MHRRATQGILHVCREKWTFPAKPHLPHVMSIDFGARTGESAVVMAGKQQPQAPYSLLDVLDIAHRQAPSSVDSGLARNSFSDAQQVAMGIVVGDRSRTARGSLM